MSKRFAAVLAAVLAAFCLPLSAFAAGENTLPVTEDISVSADYD